MIWVKRVLTLKMDEWTSICLHKLVIFESFLFGDQPLAVVLAATRPRWSGEASMCTTGKSFTRCGHPTIAAHFAAAQSSGTSTVTGPFMPFAHEPVPVPPIPFDEIWGATVAAFVRARVSKAPYVWAFVWCLCVFMVITRNGVVMEPCEWKSYKYPGEAVRRLTVLRLRFRIRSSLFTNSSMFMTLLV